MLRAYDLFLRRLSKRHSRKGLYEFLGTEARSVPQGATVLSVGSGGQVNELLAGYPFQLYQIDVDPNRNPDILGDICTIDLGEERFDMIVMSEVLEHVHSPHAAIENVRRALKTGGKLVLSAPFMLPIHEAPRDFYRFTGYGLEFLLRDFSPVSVRARNSFGEAIGVTWLRIPTGARLIISPLVLLAWPIFQMFRSDSATTGYVATAVK